MTVPEQPPVEDAILTQLQNISEANNWGTGNRKSLDDLLLEVRKGDCVVELDINRQVVRKTRPVFIEVLYSCDGVTYRLVEARQKWKNGDEKISQFPENVSMGEKAIGNESPFVAVQRAIAEELKNLSLSVQGAVPQFQFAWELVETGRSYPGLPNKSTNSRFLLILQPNQGLPKPFIEEQEKKIIEFEWVVVQDEAQVS